MTLELDLSFVAPGARLAELRDGDDAGAAPRSYQARATELARNRRVKITLARNGGWVARTMNSRGDP